MDFRNETRLVAFSFGSGPVAHGGEVLGPKPGPSGEGFGQWYKVTSRIQIISWVSITPRSRVLVPPVLPIYFRPFIGVMKL